MPSEITDYGTQALLSVLFAIDPPLTGFYIALCTDAPGIDSDGTILAELEPVDAAYSRQLYGVGATNWGLNANYLTTLQEIDFSVPTVDWGLITHYALTDSPTDGELYGFGEFFNASYVSAGFGFVVPPGGVVVSMSSVQDSIAV